MTNNSNAGTPAAEVEFDNLDDLLGLTESIIGSDEPVKPSVFDGGKVDTSFLDDENIDPNNPDALKDVNVTKDDISKLVDDELEEEEEEDDAKKSVNKGGRPSLTKDALVEATQSLIDEGVLQGFDDDKPLTEYTVNDFKELIQANIENQVSTTAQNAPVELFQTLPEEVQAVVSYALNGGSDLKTVFGQLAKAQETFDLDIENENDQETIIRQWLNSLNVDTPEEIEDEINLLKDRGDLQKYAERYKPKLDAKQAEIIQKRLDDQKSAEIRKQEQSKKYQTTVFNALNTTELNGIPLTPKVQNMLYYGLIDKSKYQDSKGRPTNALGYYLEQHQFGEKTNPGLVAEALWLLADPDGYRASIKQIGTKEANAKTVRMLKGEEASRQGSAGSGSSDARGGNAGSRKQPMARPQKSIFGR
jgi:hypothetical protein